MNSERKFKISFKDAKSIITKSNIPSVDYVINPYIGCQHGCIYCYAEFMIRFTHHEGDKWGDFLDIKKFNPASIKPQKYNGKTILLSSVTDPYLPLEIKYQNTRKILEKLVGTEAEITILTKSKLVVRDIDLFKRFKNIEVGISICTSNDIFAGIIERTASKPSERIQALKEVSKAGIKTWIFISPFFPGITDFKEIIAQTEEFADYFMFENLNFRPHNVPRIKRIIKEHNPELVPMYEEFQKDPGQWEFIAEEIKAFCEEKRLRYSIEFHHGGFSKT